MNEKALCSLIRFQRKMLAETRILEAQLTVDDIDLTAPLTKDWRTAHTFYAKGFQWTSGSTLLSPAGFPTGHLVRGHLNSLRSWFFYRDGRDLGLTPPRAAMRGRLALKIG